MAPQAASVVQVNGALSVPKILNRIAYLSRPSMAKDIAYFKDICGLHNGRTNSVQIGGRLPLH